MTYNGASERHRNGAVETTTIEDKKEKKNVAPPFSFVLSSFFYCLEEQMLLW
jgi:hypothetical protein